MQSFVPDRFHRIELVRRAPPASLDHHAAELSLALDALAGLHPAFVSFLTRDNSYAVVACDVTRDLPAPLGQSRIVWADRCPDDPSHELCLFNGEDGGGYVDVRTSFVLPGETLRVDPGLSVELRLGRFIEDAGAEALRAVLDALVRTLKPDFAFVEPAGTTNPVPSRPREPVVRWLTYLARERRPISDLKAPNTSYPIDDLGTAYLAAEALASAAEVPQKQALAQLQLALYPVVPDPALRPPEPPPKAPEPPPPVVAQAIPSFLQRAPAPAPSVPPPPASVPPPAPAPPPDAAARRRQNSGTVDLTKIAPAPALPFAGPSERPAAPRPAPRPHAQNARTVDIEAALAEAKGGRQALPFAQAPAPRPQAPAPVRVAVPPLTLEQYASLSAELNVYPDRPDEVMSRYGVMGRPVLDALREAYRGRFEKDPGMLQSFNQLEIHYRDWFFRQKWRDAYNY